MTSHNIYSEEQVIYLMRAALRNSSSDVGPKQFKNNDDEMAQLITLVEDHDDHYAEDIRRVGQ